VDLAWVPRLKLQYDDRLLSFAFHSNSRPFALAPRDYCFVRQRWGPGSGPADGSYYSITRDATNAAGGAADGPADKAKIGLNGGGGFRVRKIFAAQRIRPVTLASAPSASTSDQYQHLDQSQQQRPPLQRQHSLPVTPEQQQEPQVRRQLQRNLSLPAHPEQQQPQQQQQELERQQYPASSSSSSSSPQRASYASVVAAGEEASGGVNGEVSGVGPAPAPAVDGAELVCIYHEVGTDGHLQNSPRHQTQLNPCLLIYMASLDAASTINQSLPRGQRRAGGGGVAQRIESAACIHAQPGGRAVQVDLRLTPD